VNLREDREEDRCRLTLEVGDAVGDCRSGRDVSIVKIMMDWPLTYVLLHRYKQEVVVVSVCAEESEVERLC
jgi:hypothetical protein